MPQDSSIEAINQWFDFLLHPVGPIRCVEAVWNTKIDCGGFLRDGWRLARHLQATDNPSLVIQENPASNPHKVLCELEKLRNQLFPKVAPPLTIKEQAVLDLIKEHQPIQGPQILDLLEEKGIPLAQSTLTAHIIPKLVEWYGVNNRPRAGYYIKSVK